MNYDLHFPNAYINFSIYICTYMMIGREQTIACVDDLGIHNKKRQIRTTIRIKIENESKKTGLKVNEQKIEIT